MAQQFSSLTGRTPITCHAARRSMIGLPSHPTASVKGKMALFLLDHGPKAQPFGDIPGTIEDLRWTPGRHGID